MDNESTRYEEGGFQGGGGIDPRAMYSYNTNPNTNHTNSYSMHNEGHHTNDHSMTSDLHHPNQLPGIQGHHSHHPNNSIVGAGGSGSMLGHHHRAGGGDMYHKGGGGVDPYDPFHRNLHQHPAHPIHYNFSMEKEKLSYDESSQPNHSTTTAKKEEGGGQRKRTRASADQLAILEEAFVHNSSPNSRTREILAEKVNMSERSVQIWFQNRRAKVKLMQKRNYMLQEEAMKHQLLNTGNGYLNNQIPFGSSTGSMGGAGLALSHSNAGFSSYNMHMFPNDGMAMSSSTSHMNMVPMSQGQEGMGKNLTRSLSMGSVNPNFNKELGMGMKGGIMGRLRCDCLSIGSWRRKTVQLDDLVCFYNLSQRMLTWQVTDKNLRFKMELPFAAIVSIRLNLPPSTSPNPTNLPNHPPPSTKMASNQAEAVFDTNQVPNFYMEAEFQNQLVWTPCRDFTENSQATRFFKHVLLCDFNLLKNDIQELANKDINLRNITFIPEIGGENLIGPGILNLNHFKKESDLDEEDLNGNVNLKMGKVQGELGTSLNGLDLYNPPQHHHHPHQLQQQQQQQQPSLQRHQLDGFSNLTNPQNNQNNQNPNNSMFLMRSDDDKVPHPITHQPIYPSQPLPPTHQMEEVDSKLKFLDLPNSN